MRKLIFAVALFVFSFAFNSTAHAQAADVGFGFGTLLAPAADKASGNHYPQSIRGGLYNSVSAAVWLKPHLGFNGEAAWRAKQNFYNTPFGFFPFRPILYDFNAITGSRFNKYVGADAMAGLGAESVRFYSPNFTCGFTGCSNYTSSTHFLLHLGGDVRLYVHGNFFIRPEIHYYWVHNNNEFSSDHMTRVGASIGYSFFSR